MNQQGKNNRKKKTKSKPILQRIEHFFDRHGRISLFLSHGAFLITTGLILVSAIIILLALTANINESRLRKIDITISEYANTASKKVIADMSLLKIKAFLDGTAHDEYSEPCIGVLPITMNREHNHLNAYLVTPDGKKITEADSIVFSTFTEVEIDVPELKEAVSSNYSDASAYIHHVVNPDGEQLGYSMDIRPITKENKAIFKTYYTENAYYCNEYLVTSEHLFKETSARNPYINLYFNIKGIESIYPKPNQITPDIIGYVGNESVREVLENGGIYVQLYDTVAKAKAERLLLWGSILIGLLFGMLLDIIVELFHKWKKLARNDQ